MLLGHHNIKTTLECLHVSNCTLNQVKSCQQQLAKIQAEKQVPN
jgi:hypothetical protein